MKYCFPLINLSVFRTHWIAVRVTGLLEPFPNPNQVASVVQGQLHFLLQFKRINKWFPGVVFNSLNATCRHAASGIHSWIILKEMGMIAVSRNWACLLTGLDSEKCFYRLCLFVVTLLPQTPWDFPSNDTEGTGICLLNETMVTYQ